MKISAEAVAKARAEDARPGRIVAQECAGCRRLRSVLEQIANHDGERYQWVDGGVACAQKTPQELAAEALRMGLKSPTLPQDAISTGGPRS